MRLGLYNTSNMTLAVLQEKNVCAQKKLKGVKNALLTHILVYKSYLVTFESQIV